MAKNYTAGNVVPESGIYRVYHDSHRLMHTATLLAGTLFPTCRRCKAAVQFELVRRVKTTLIPPFRNTAYLQEYPTEPPVLAA